MPRTSKFAKRVEALIRRADEYYESIGQPEKSTRVRLEHFARTGELPKPGMQLPMEQPKTPSRKKVK